MSICFASYNEAFDISEPEHWEPDRICMLEDGHAGEHDWRPEDEVEIRFYADGE